jgi:type VI secretion system secreted protein Hcp
MQTKIRIAGAGVVVALAAAWVAAVALGAGGGKSGIDLGTHDLAANMAIANLQGGDPGSPTMQIESWSWSVTNTGTATGVGGGRATLHDVTVTKVIDKASPQLVLDCAAGRLLPTVTLDVLRPGGSKQAYLEIKLTDALVTSVQHSGSGDQQPLENVTFDYRRIEKYTTIRGQVVDTLLTNTGTG